MRKHFDFYGYNAPTWGRYYHDGGFSYVLMTGECKKENRTKIKIEKWLGEENLPKYEAFVMQWKHIQETAREEIAKGLAMLPGEEAMVKQKEQSMALLAKYYLQPYGEEFFGEFSSR